LKTYVFGNGLSRSFNDEHYRLDNLSDAVARALRRRPTGLRRTLLDDVKELGEALYPGGYSGGNFEKLAGPIDTLAQTLVLMSALSWLVRYDEAKASLLLEMSENLSRIHRQVAGIVLDLVAGVRVEGNTQNIKRVAEHIFEVAEEKVNVDVFTLNYDARLDSELLELHRLSETTYLSDEFDGRPEREVEIPLQFRNRIVRLAAKPWRTEPYVPAGNAVRLHHLHGAATWLEWYDEVFKASSLDSLRTLRVFNAWGNGVDLGPRPAVVLTDQKGRAVERSPFNKAYSDLMRAVWSADEVVIAGYAFNDEPVNNALVDAARSFTKFSIHGRSPESHEVAARALEPIASQLLFFTGSLPESLILSDVY
jgi:hypothetical protein